MKLYLAPMQGVVDQHVRTLLTEVGGFQHCVTEFIRVTDKVLPTKNFIRLCPELLDHCRTPSGTPVTIQLLGGDEYAMADNALKAIELGAPSIDINFGCPSKVVNRKAGGAVLLKEPDRVHNITAAVRKAVPDHIPVTAKIRLGYEDTTLAMENAHAVESAKADFITVHARTKIDGYTHPARWEWIGRINDVLTIPVVANGDINSVEDFIRCKDICGCDDYMIGRGVLCRPDLAAQLQAYAQGTQLTAYNWEDIKPFLRQFIISMQAQTNPVMEERKILGRLKQWLAYLKTQYPEAELAFQTVRGKKSLEDGLAVIAP